MQDNTPQITFASSDISFGNMSVTKGDADEALNNRQNFFESLGINESQVIPMNLGDSTEIIRVGVAPTDNFSMDMAEISDDTEVIADGLVTETPNLFLFMLSGDCIPLAVIDPKNSAVGLAHCSWKNLNDGIVKNLIMRMNAQFGSDSGDLLVKFGPSIGPCCYIKKTEDLKQQRDPRWKPFIKNIDIKTSQVDIWAFTESELTRFGIQKENIEIPKICTYHSKKYFSHRRFVVEKEEKDYRFATILGIKEYL